MQFQKILVAIDFSDSSLKALEVARDLAEHYQGELHLFHAFPCDPPIVAPYAPAIPAEHLDKVRAAATEHLHQWRKEYLPGDMNVTEHISHFTPSTAIVELAAELSADLIVIGTRGLTGLKHVILGSVADRVVRTAHCPVLSVKAETEPSH